MESFLEVVDLLEFSLPDMINDIMLSFDTELININQKDQLSFGIDAKGKVIKTKLAKGSNVYADFTIKERKAKGLQTNKVDLNYTGKFWKTFKVKKVNEGWEITANYNIYSPDILTNFDSSYDFLGIIPPFLKEFVLKELIPELEKRIKLKLKT